MENEEKKPIILESGTYEMSAPESGDISIEKLILTASSGAKRIWKLKSLDQKQALFDIEKFG